MKKIYLFMTTFLCGLNLLGQIPNASFENWGVNSWSNPQPIGWTVVTTPVVCTSQYTNAYQGTSAFKFENFYWIDRWVDLAANTGSSSTNYFLPIGPKPTKLFGYYKFSNTNTQDGMYCYVYIKSGGSTIGTGSFYTNTSTNVYTQFIANINYSSVAVPDSFRIVLGLTGTCTGGGFGCDYSYFIVDNLSFDINVGIKDNGANNQMKIYPNPTNNFLTFQNLDNQSETLSIYIYNTKGLLINQYFVNEKIFKLDLSDFEPGLYFSVLTFSDGRTMTHKFVKQ